MATATLSAKGWVVIPQELRERYGLKKGDKVHFVDYGGVMAIVPASEDPVEAAAGMLRGGPPLVQGLLGGRKEDAEREEVGARDKGQERGAGNGKDG